MSEIFPPVANSAYLRENYSSNKALNGSPIYVDNLRRGEDCWKKILTFSVGLSWNWASYSIQISTRYINGTLSLSVFTGASGETLETLLSSTGHFFRESYEARLVSSIEGQSRIFSVWVRLSAWDGGGFLRVTDENPRVSSVYPLTIHINNNTLYNPDVPDGEVSAVTKAGFNCINHAESRSVDMITLTNGATHGLAANTGYEVDAMGNVAFHLNLLQSPPYETTLTTLPIKPKSRVVFPVYANAEQGFAQIKTNGMVSIVSGSLNNIEGSISFKGRI